ncbi:MAG: CRTAC1 family protein [Bryobacteraceae bacterium]|nr:CRTAC1 family protein [Bryobacteraceae bacterium]
MWRALLLLALIVSAALLWPSATPSRIVFENAIQKSGIAYKMFNSVSAEKHQVETMLAGVAVLDYNNDGLLDIYFVNGAQLPQMDKSGAKWHNRLYRNNGDGTFTDVTARAGLEGAGYGMGVAVGDYDNDGYEDIYIAGVNRNQLFHNNGDGTFSDVTEKAGVSGIHSRFGKTWGISAGWFDYDNDGRLDLLVVNYVNWNIGSEPPCKVGPIRAYCSPSSYTGQPNTLYHNNGDGTFTDVSAQSGIDRQIGKGMGAAFADYDGDGFTDIFVSNDTYRNFLFHNNGNGTFTEQAILSGVAYNENGRSIAGMGADFRDIDNDGRPDIFVVAMVGDTFPLFHNAGRGFTDITSSSGVAKASAGVTAWGSGIFDFDNDGNKDLFATCASILDNSEEIDQRPSKLPNMVLRNLGTGTGALRFSDVSREAGASFQTPAAHRGVAFGDLNNDGKMDAIVVVQNDRPEIWMNRSPEPNHWLLLRLEGVRSNRDGLGARVKITPNLGGPQWNHATTSTGFSTASDRRVHFGLGRATRVDRLEIWWPSGIHQVLANIRADQVLDVREDGVLRPPSGK